MVYGYFCKTTFWKRYLDVAFETPTNNVGNLKTIGATGAAAEAAVTRLRRLRN